MRERFIHLHNYIESSICCIEMLFIIFPLYDVLVASNASGTDMNDSKLIEAQLGAVCLPL